MRRQARVVGATIVEGGVECDENKVLGNSSNFRIPASCVVLVSRRGNRGAKGLQQIKSWEKMEKLMRSRRYAVIPRALTLYHHAKLQN